VNANGAPRPLRIVASGALIGALRHNGPIWPANGAPAYAAVASPEMLPAGLRLAVRNAALLFRYHDFVLRALPFGFLVFVLRPLRLRNLATRRCTRWIRFRAG
jgi:hypothetical protein